jgi:SAM-dependent methyltransferase
MPARQQRHIPLDLGLTAGGVHLHLGCGAQWLDPAHGWVNCDRVPTTATDLVFDLMQPWPFPDHGVDSVYASHVLEHLPDAFAFFREAWRVLQDGALMLLRMPHGGHPSAMADVTHLRPWYPESFYCLMPGYGETNSNPQHADWPAPFGVRHVDMVLEAWTMPWLRWRWLCRRLIPWLPRFVGSVSELWVVLIALKSPQSTALYQAELAHDPHRFRYCQWAHVLDGRPVSDDDPTTLVPLAALTAAPR